MANRRASKKGRPYAEIGGRLERIRGKLGFNSARMSAALGVSEGMWSQYQSGSRRITTKPAIRLCAIGDVTLDFIYRGKLT
jgi:transcriptional regulator with XRE-family HTH domain